MSKVFFIVVVADGGFLGNFSNSVDVISLSRSKVGGFERILFLVYFVYRWSMGFIGFLLIRLLVIVLGGENGRLESIIGISFMFLWLEF